MNPTIISGLLLIVAAICFFSLPKIREQHWLSRGAEFFANGLLANVHHFGRVTRKADATGVFTERYLLCKEGTTPGATIALCGAADQPLGVVPDMTPSTDTDTSYPLLVNVFSGAMEETQRAIASAAISIGKFIVPAASGKVKALPTSGGGSTFIIGVALTAAAADEDQIEFAPCFPIPTTIAT
jgi:hypothetical protein